MPKKVKLSSLKLLEDNPRVITPEDLDKLKKSLDEFPKMMTVRGIVVDKDKVIIGGNQRYKGLIALGYTEVPESWIQDASSFTEEERKNFIIRDNVGFGSFDYEKALESYEVPTLMDFGVDLPKHYRLGSEEPYIPEKPAGSYETQHAVIILCDDVDQQNKVFDELKAQGYNLKIVST